MATVNVPTNPKIKERDINNKLQLYGIYSAFSNGKAPSNQQIDIALNSLLASDALTEPSSKLSAEGHELIADVRDVIQKAKELFLSKNEGNILQDFIWQCQKATSGDATKPTAPLNKETAQQHGNEALEGFRTLGTLLITNGQFRKLLNDAVILLRDIAGDGAQKLADKVNPDEDQLKQIDEAAQDNTWHDSPDISVSKLKEQAKSSYQQNKPFSRSDVENAANKAQDSAQEEGTTQQESASVGAAAGANHLVDKAKENVPDETQDKAKEQVDKTVETAKKQGQRTKNYLSSKMPKERREQVIWRLKKMVVEIQGHPDYQRAIETLLRLAETYHGHGTSLAKDSANAVKDAHTDDGLAKAEQDLKLLLERFANGTSFDDLFDSVNQLYRDADQDSELKQWYRQLTTYLRKCLKEQGYIMEDQANDEWNKLYEKGNFLLRERYRDHTNRVGDELKFLADQYDKDPQNRAFAESLNKLFSDLGTDENGQVAFKPHLLKDVTQVIIPEVFENIRYVPIPRIEYSDPVADAVIENLVIESDNLAPNVVEFGSDNYWRWARKQIPSKNKNKVMLAVAGIQLDMRDVSYYIKKKQGFPSLTDTGIMDIFLGGTGLSFRLAMETADKSDQQHFFKVNNVSVDVKNMKIKIKKSNHKLLFNVFKPLLLSVMRPILTRVLQRVIKEKIHQADGFLHDVYVEAQRAADEVKRNPDPENVDNLFQRYYTAIKTRLAEGKEKVENVKQAAQDKHFNMAITRHDAIFKDVKLPGGTSTKATEFKELAAKGEEWQSPVFAIGSSAGSASLPKAPNVVRKPHTTAPSQLRDPPRDTSSTTSTTHVNGITSSSTSGALNADGRTTLGASNPVLTGSA